MAPSRLLFFRGAGAGAEVPDQREYHPQERVERPRAVVLSSGENLVDHHTRLHDLNESIRLENLKDIWRMLHINQEHEFINGRNRYGHTSLHKAAALGHRHILLLLVIKGAFVKAETASGQTPLHVAFEKRQLSNAITLQAFGSGWWHPNWKPRRTKKKPGIGRTTISPRK